jgi:hypothetical protein
MKIRWFRFNINFALTLALVAGALLGCKSTDPDKKAVSTLRLHMEGKANAMQTSETVSIHDVPVVVLADPFITEANISKAKVIDTVGGFSISLQFDRRGTWMIEQYTADNPGKHIAIFAQWVTPPEEKPNKGRWLAAPKFDTHLGNGQIVFTPDATREEADKIVRGLNNVAKKIDKKDATARW